jgi:hypothetical protein
VTISYCFSALRRLLLFVLLIALSGCGGGGGGGDSATPTDPTTVFDLTGFKSLTQGVKFSFNLTGSDNSGGSWSGVYRLTINAVQNVNGQLLTPADIYINLVESHTNTVISDVTTTYYDASGDLVSRITQGSGVTCTPTSVSKLPDTVLIGDFGVTPSFDCSDGTTITGTWAIENANNGYAYLVISATIRDFSNAIFATEIDKFKINTMGNPSSVIIKLAFPQSGYSMSLSGTP